MDHQFQIYKSSAGSGKTYTLVKEYLKIVLPDPGNVRHILAITFTNAAAAEMKDRIVSELGSIISLDTDPENAKATGLVEQIRSEWKEAQRDVLSKQQVIANARKVLKIILHKYSDFSVSTIDSFVHRVIRTFAFDLYLPFHFDVELDAEALLSQATDTLISRVGTEKNLTELLISFILNQADDETDLRIEKMISEMGKTLMDEDGSQAVTSLKDISLDQFLKISVKLKSLVKKFEMKAGAVAREAMGLIEKEGLSAGDFFQGSRGIYSYFERLAVKVTAGSITPNANARKTIDQDKWQSGKAGPAEIAILQAISPGLKEAFFEITGPDDLLIKMYKVYLAVGKYIFPVAVLNELERVLEEIKTENVLLHISDFNKKIAEIVAEQPVPFIYERLGERYRHYMIDEFQDTSGLQWQNLLPLVDNALAGGQMSLVVGDGKQAIYRFRNGDVEQFAMLPYLTPQIRSVAKPGWEKNLVANARMNPLKTNYRSKPEIVTFNNRFFNYVKQYLSDDLKTIYDEAEQLSLSSKKGGYAEIRFVDQEYQPHAGMAENDPEETQAALKEEEQDPSYEKASLEHILEIIGHLRQSGHTLNDITILCRSNREASLVARTLLEKQIPVISSDSLLLNQSDDVNFIIAVLRLLSDPFNQIAAMSVVSYLHKTGLIQTPASLHECLVAAGLFYPAPAHKDVPLTAAIEKILSKNGLAFSFSEFFHQNLYDTCETIIRTFFAGKQPPSPFVAFFSDVLYDYSAKNSLVVNDFLEWWEAGSKNFSLVVPAGINAVQVMTIHKSKGLQFRIVIVPFASFNLKKTTKKGQWVDIRLDEIPELEATWIGLSAKALQNTPFEALHAREINKSYLDSLNMAYVAFTRAEDKLFILTKKARSYKPEFLHGLLHGFLKEEGVWDDGNPFYSFGTFNDIPSGGRHLNNEAGTQFPDDSEVPADTAYMPGFKTIISQPWSRVLRMKSHQTERSTETGGHDSLERGNLFHRAMEKIHTGADIGRVLAQMLADGEIDSVRKQEWEKKIGLLIRLPEIAPYFAPGIKIKHEAGIFDQHGNFFRPDRVVLLDNETVVIDYKTGQQYAKHQSQMDSYARLLKQMGYPSVRKFILYLDKDKIVAC